MSREVWVGETSLWGDSAVCGWVVSAGGRSGLVAVGLGTARGGWHWGVALEVPGGAAFLSVLALAVRRGMG